MKSSGIAVWTLALAALAAVGLGACGGRSSSIRPAPPGTSGVAPDALTGFYEEKLAGATPIAAGDFRVRSLGAQLEDRPDLLGQISAEAGAPNFLILTIRNPLGESIALYVSFPEGNALASFELEPLNADAESPFLGLALPGKLQGILPIALAPLAQGEIPPLRIILGFSAKTTSAVESPVVFQGFRRNDEVKLASTPFKGEGNRVTDLYAAPSGSTVSLDWRERNTGDYNNDGTVVISDITPLAVHFNESEVPGQGWLHPIDEVIDGNGDTTINIADITPLAINFGSSISGYEVYALTIPSLDTPVAPEDFNGVEPLPNPLDPGNPHPTVPRALFYVGEPANPPEGRIHYLFSRDFPSGAYAFAVRAFSWLDDDYTDVLLSNIFKVAVAPSTNQPPTWVDTVGIQSAEPLNGAVRVGFGNATDPDGDQLHFIIYYQQGDTVDPETAMTMRVERNGLGMPPFSVTVPGLSNGVMYAFMVRVYDQYETEEDPPNDNVLTARPTDTAPNALPWPYLRKDEAHSGYLPESGLREPLVQLWAQSYLDVPGGFNESSPVLDEQNVYIGSIDGSIYGFDQLTGAPVYGDGGTQVGDIIGTSTAALYDDYLVVGVRPGSYRTIERTTGTLVSIFELDNANAVRSSAMVAGGIAYTGSEEGEVYAFSITDGSPVWEPKGTPLSNEPLSSSPATDGEFIYIASENGRVYKLRRDNGQVVATSPDLGSIAYSSPTLYPPDAPQYVLIGADGQVGLENYFYALSPSDLHIVRSFPTDRGVNGSPLVITRSEGLAVVVGEMSRIPLDTSGKLYAFDLETGDELWRTADIGRIFSSLVASATRIFVGSQNGNLYVFDYNGIQRGPPIDLGAAIYTSPAIFQDRLYIANSNSVLYCFQMEPDTTPPHWLSTVGAASAETSFGEATIHWGPAQDNFYSQVYYQLFYADNPNIDFTNPDGTLEGTTLVKDITDLSYTVSGLEDGKRYYFAVRVSDLPWDDAPNIDDNAVVIGATPPWNLLKTFQLDDGVLPAGPPIDYLEAAWDNPDVVVAYSDENTADAGHIRYFRWDGENDPQPPEEVYPAPPPTFQLARELELSRNFAGEDLLAFPGSDFYYYAERTSPGSWSLYSDPLFDIPVHPAISVSHGADTRLMAVLHQEALPSTNVTVMVRRGDSTVWFGEEILASGLVLPMYIRAYVANFTGVEEVPLVLFQNSSNAPGGSVIPDRGKLLLFRHEEGAWSGPILVDDGGHGDNGDTGKSLTLYWDASQEALLVAYYDFWNNGGTPAGRIRMATITESAASTEDVAPVNMPSVENTPAHYYHSLGLTLVSGTATIASFSRTKHPAQGDPISVNDLYYLSRQGAGSWDSELVTEGVTEYLFYSAPLELLPSGPQGYPLLTYVTGEDSPDSIVIWQRGPLAQ